MDAHDQPKPRLLLHVCCAPCSTACIERLQAEYELVLFWYNPNITDPDEYRRRLAEARRYAGTASLTLIEGRPDTEAWEAAAQGLMEEPEGGRRCDACFRVRLRAAAHVAEEQGIERLTTTLTISPHKPLAKVQAAAEQALGGTTVTYLPIDFKKQGGFERSRELSRGHNLYRQDFCGCEPSRIERNQRRGR
ncbi:MAG: epoxyqueuosine reductase QueH [Armatimonadetes bacterium]|nr:epoxyqueuosine reductase QueH [Armatimonadota bacterium]